MSFHALKAGIAAAILVFTPLRAAGAEEARTLVIMYPDMNPFIQPGEREGEASGPLVEWISRVAGEAGVSLVWKGPVPRARILAELETGVEACHPNARLTEQREGKFKFSAPLFPPPRWRVLTRRGSQVEAFASASDLLRDQSLVLGHMLGATMGPELDDILAQRKGNTLAVRGSPLDLLRLLRAGRIDYLVADMTAIPADRGNVSFSTDDLRELQFADLPEADAGRIMCSLSVPDQVIERLNRAIEEVQRTSP